MLQAIARFTNAERGDPQHGSFRHRFGIQQAQVAFPQQRSRQDHQKQRVEKCRQHAHTLVAEGTELIAGFGGKVEAAGG